MRQLACLVFALGVGGCSLHFGGGDDAGDDVCDQPPVPSADQQAIPAVGMLDPETLQCEYFGGGYPPCDPACGDECPPPPPTDQPTWAYCYAGCEGLDELACFEATACRAAYDYACYTGGPCTLLTPFIGCYGVDQTGPIQGSCTGLGAQECSRHNDCVALHDQSLFFVECRDESTCWGPVLCLDVPTPVCPPGSTPEVRNGCYTGECIPLDECEPATADPV